MKSFPLVIEQDAQTGLFVGYVPGWPGAHAQGVTVEAMRSNLAEVVSMLLEDGEPRLESQFIGTDQLKVA
jgi:predicted RNase H-like HicB family nuclease